MARGIVNFQPAKRNILSVKQVKKIINRGTNKKKLRSIVKD